MIIPASVGLKWTLDLEETAYLIRVYEERLAELKAIEAELKLKEGKDGDND